MDMTRFLGFALCVFCKAAASSYFLPTTVRQPSFYNILSHNRTDIRMNIGTEMLKGDEHFTVYLGYEGMPAGILKPAGGVVGSRAREVSEVSVEAFIVALKGIFHERVSSDCKCGCGSCDICCLNFSKNDKRCICNVASLECSCVSKSNL